MQVLDRADIEIEQPTERQIDRRHLIEIDPLVDSSEVIKILLGKRQRCRGTKSRPIVAGESEVPVGHGSNPTLRSMELGQPGW